MSAYFRFSFQKPIAVVNIPLQCKVAEVSRDAAHIEPGGIEVAIIMAVIKASQHSPIGSNLKFFGQEPITNVCHDIQGIYLLLIYLGIDESKGDKSDEFANYYPQSGYGCALK